MSSAARDRPTLFGDAFPALIVAARAGSPWAWERLYDALAPSVAGYLRMQGAQDPDDLSSEVWLGVFRGIGSFEGDERRFRSWVFVIAHRRLTDERRRAGRSTAWSPDRTASSVVRAAEDEALRRLDDDGITATLCRLAPAQRDVLLLRIVAGLTIEEIARALGKSEGSVKALQRRGFESLRRNVPVEGVPL